MTDRKQWLNFWSELRFKPDSVVEFEVKFLSLYDKRNFHRTGDLRQFTKRQLQLFMLNEDIDDILNEAYLIGVRYAERGNIINWNSWLKATCLNIIRNKKRKQFREQLLDNKQLDNELTCQKITATLTIDDISQEDASLQYAFEELNDREKLILNLHIVEGFSWREVGDHLVTLGEKPTSLEVVRRYGNQALKKLRSVYQVHSRQHTRFKQSYSSSKALFYKPSVTDDKPTEGLPPQSILPKFKSKPESEVISSTSLEEIPLLDLFTQLQEAGLPLGIGEYFLVLRALQKGFGTADQQALAELCQTLWVKSKDEEHLFNYHFEQVMRTVPSPSNFSPTEMEQELPPSLPASDARQEIQDGRLEGEESPAPALSPTISQELMEVEEEIQVAEAVQIATSLEGEVILNRFTQSDEYFPVTRRQMKQSWRHLRRMVREGPLVEIDIEATIARFSQQGIPSEPVLVPGRINRTELLLLIDQKGSMVPFHALSQRLTETAQRGGRLGEAGVFYFHNCPTQYLYRDPSRQKAELVSNLLMKLRPERSVVLIFSDGGAARGGFNPQRLELTKQFLDQLKHRVRHVTWLNPMAKERWAGTTAGDIAQQVPMFEMSRRGMDGAIDVLRGRSLQVVG